MAGSKWKNSARPQSSMHRHSAARRSRGGRAGRAAGSRARCRVSRAGSPARLTNSSMLAGRRLAGQLGQLGPHLLRPDLAQLVDDAQDRQVAFGQARGRPGSRLNSSRWDTWMRKRGTPRARKLSCDDHQDLEVRRGGVRADDVEVDLDELAVAPALGVLPAPDLGHVVALEGQVQLVDVGGHEAGEGDGEVEAQGHVPLAVVPEAVDLLVRLPAALAQQDLRVLQGRGVDGHEAEAPENAGKLLLHRQAAHLRLRQGIAEAAQGLGIDDVRTCRL